MTKKSEIYKCSKCGNIITINHDGNGEVFCCNEPMRLIKENSTEASTEKHIPVLNKIDDINYIITVGEVEHPMTPEHYIEWIEVLTDKNSRLTFFLEPNEKPEITLATKDKIIEVKVFCNLHGLWCKYPLF